MKPAEPTENIDEIDARRAKTFYIINIICMVCCFIVWLFVIPPVILALFWKESIIRDRQEHLVSAGLYHASLWLTVAVTIWNLALIIVIAVFTFGIGLILLVILIPFVFLILLHGAALCCGERVNSLFGPLMARTQPAPKV